MYFTEKNAFRVRNHTLEATKKCVLKSVRLEKLDVFYTKKSNVLMSNVFMSNYDVFCTYL